MAQTDEPTPEHHECIHAELANRLTRAEHRALIERWSNAQVRAERAEARAVDRGGVERIEALEEALSAHRDVHALTRALIEAILEADGPRD
jgi:hypothetical protein